jgi:hypothetical protein
MSKKRTLDSFFAPDSKKQKKEEPVGDEKVKRASGDLIHGRSLLT